MLRIARDAYLGDGCRGVRRLAVLVLGCFGAALRAAEAAEPAPDCPPEEWICDAAPGTPELASPSESPPIDTPPTDAAPPAPASQLDLEVREPDSFESPPPAFGFERSSPWSVNLRVQGSLLSGRNSEAAGLGGIGASLRYDTNPIATLDLGLDSFLGKDYEHRDRAETSLSGSVLLYLNPESPVRTYAIFGIHYDWAQVDVAGDQQTWTYFGAQAGLGLDIRIYRRLMFDFDLLGFMRGRTDSRAAREPEFTAANGRQTNTSGGALARAGVVLRW